MASSAIVWAGTLYRGTAGSDPANTNPIGEVLDAGSDEQKDMVEVTSRDSSGNREYVPGLYGAKVAVTANFLKADTNGQTAARTAFEGGTLEAYRLNWDDGSNNGYGIYGDAYITSWKVTSSVGDKVTVAFDLQFSGAVTYDPDSV